MAAEISGFAYWNKIKHGIFLIFFASWNSLFLINNYFFFFFFLVGDPICFYRVGGQVEISQQCMGKNFKNFQIVSKRDRESSESHIENLCQVPLFWKTHIYPGQEKSVVSPIKPLTYLCWFQWAFECTNWAVVSTRLWSCIDDIHLN